MADEVLAGGGNGRAESRAGGLPRAERGRVQKPRARRNVRGARDGRRRPPKTGGERESGTADLPSVRVLWPMSRGPHVWRQTLEQVSAVRRARRQQLLTFTNTCGYELLKNKSGRR